MAELLDCVMPAVAAKGLLLAVLVEVLLLVVELPLEETGGVVVLDVPVELVPEELLLPVELAPAELEPVEFDGPVASLKSTMNVSIRVVHPKDVSGPSVPPQ